MPNENWDQTCIVAAAREEQRLLAASASSRSAARSLSKRNLGSGTSRSQVKKASAMKIAPVKRGRGRGAARTAKDIAVDAHVGARIKLRRSLLGMSQVKLAQAVNLTFQQIQKYERGANRVGASKLWQIAQVLEVPISFFYDGLTGGAEIAANFEVSRRFMEMAANFSSLPEHEQREFARLIGASAARHRKQ